MPKGVTVSWEKRKDALSSSLKGTGLRSASAVRLIRRLCEGGNAQMVLEAVTEVLLSTAILSGAVPANAGVLSKDFALAVEESLHDVARAYLNEGAVIFRFVSVDSLHAELCRQWLRGFAPPLPQEPVVEGELSDPAVHARLTVAALKLRNTLAARGALSADALSIPLDSLEGLCRTAVEDMFLAFKNPNEINHRLIHGEHDGAK